ncbi:RNase H family protein [Vibrio tritonius]|uniref:RNase H family protein n=1 Tax=Vibrio tritonius TaxID=1435069 RepID=UPI00315D2F6E
MTSFIYIDVAAPNNHEGCKRGGIGMAVLDEDNNVECKKGLTIERDTNNAELDLMALQEALEYSEDGDVIYSTSDYCVKGFNDWLDGWKSKGWRKSDRKPVQNRQLWQVVDELRSRKYVEVRKVKAHSGIRGNEIANSLAIEAAEL